VAFIEEFALYGARTILITKCAQFVDRESVNGLPHSAFIRQYARYLLEKVNNFNELSFNVEKKLEPANKGFFNDYSPNQLGKCLPKFMKQMNALVECHGIIAGNEFVIHDIVRYAVLQLIKDSLRLYPSIQLCLWQMICSFQKLTLEQVKWTSRTWDRYLTLNKAYEEWFQRCVRMDIIEESYAPKFDVLSESLIVKLNDYITTHENDDEKEIPKKNNSKKSKEEETNDKSEKDWEAFDTTSDNTDKGSSKPTKDAKNGKTSVKDSNKEMSNIDELLDSNEMNDFGKEIKKLKKETKEETKEKDLLNLFNDDPFTASTTPQGSAKKSNNAKQFDNGDNWLQSIQMNPPANTVSSATLDWISDFQSPTSPPSQQQQGWTNNFDAPSNDFITSAPSQPDSIYNMNNGKKTDGMDNDLFAAFDNTDRNVSSKPATAAMSGQGQARKLEKKRPSDGQMQGDAFGELIDFNDWS